MDIPLGYTACWPEMSLNGGTNPDSDSTEIALTWSSGNSAPARTSGIPSRTETTQSSHANPATSHVPQSITMTLTLGHPSDIQSGL